MSTQLYYTIPNSNQRSPNTMSYPDGPGILAGARRRTPPQQGFGPGGINMYQQQQIQTALYQQQQIEFAQQQAQLEMHLQLEQMRLQNLALQEQIMIGQVQAHQAHAQAQAEQQLQNTFYSTKPVSGRMTFTQGQGGILAERALARRQQAEADALYAKCYPNIEEEEDVLREFGHAPPFSSVSSDRSSNLTPPAVVVSKPDEAFPLLAPVASSLAPENEYPKLAKQGDQHSFTPSRMSPPPAGGNPNASQLTGSGSITSTDTVQDKPSPPAKKKFSDVVKSSSKPTSTTSVNPNNVAAPAPKLNPFSSVFVPGSTGGPTSESTSPSATSSPVLKVVTFSDPDTDNATPSPVYRAPRSKSPPSAKGNRPSLPLTPTVQSIAGGIPTRQPRGPAAEAELTNQNFAARIRKRAIGAIKTLGTRPSSSPSPNSSGLPPNYHYYQQQQMLEALMMQQHQQQALAAAGYVDSDVGFHPTMAPASGIAHLMATARAREERFGY